MPETNAPSPVEPKANILDSDKVGPFVERFFEGLRHPATKAYARQNIANWLKRNPGAYTRMGAFELDNLQDAPAWLSTSRAAGDIIVRFAPSAGVLAELANLKTLLLDLERTARRASSPGDLHKRAQDRLATISRSSVESLAAYHDEWFAHARGAQKAQARILPDPQHQMRVNVEGEGAGRFWIPLPASWLRTAGHRLSNCLARGFYVKDVERGGMEVWGLFSADAAGGDGTQQRMDEHLLGAARITRSGDGWIAAEDQHWSGADPRLHREAVAALHEARGVRVTSQSSGLAPADPDPLSCPGEYLTGGLELRVGDRIVYARLQDGSFEALGRRRMIYHPVALKVEAAFPEAVPDFADALSRYIARQPLEEGVGGGPAEYIARRHARSYPVSHNLYVHVGAVLRLDQIEPAARFDANGWSGEILIFEKNPLLRLKQPGGQWVLAQFELDLPPLPQLLAERMLESYRRIATATGALEWRMDTSDPQFSRKPPILIHTHIRIPGLSRSLSVEGAWEHYGPSLRALDLSDAIIQAGDGIEVIQGWKVKSRSWGSMRQDILARRGDSLLRLTTAAKQIDFSDTLYDSNLMRGGYAFAPPRSAERADLINAVVRVGESPLSPLAAAIAGLARRPDGVYETPTPDRTLDCGARVKVDKGAVIFFKPDGSPLVWVFRNGRKVGSTMPVWHGNRESKPPSNEEISLVMSGLQELGYKMPAHFGDELSARAERLGWSWPGGILMRSTTPPIPDKVVEAPGLGRVLIRQTGVLSGLDKMQAHSTDRRVFSLSHIETEHPELVNFAQFSDWLVFVNQQGDLQLGLNIEGRGGKNPLSLLAIRELCRMTGLRLSEVSLGSAPWGLDEEGAPALYARTHPIMTGFLEGEIGRWSMGEIESLPPRYRTWSLMDRDGSMLAQRTRAGGAGWNLTFSLGVSDEMAGKILQDTRRLEAALRAHDYAPLPASKTYPAQELELNEDGGPAP